MNDEKSYAYSYFVVVLGTLYSMESLIEDTGLPKLEPDKREAQKLLSLAPDQPAI
jgi:hypothetical protein